MSSFCKQALVAVLSILAVSAFASVDEASLDASVLGQCYLKFMLFQQVAAQADTVAAAAPQADQDQIKKAAADWSAAKTRSVRTMLTARFPDDARAKFEQFVADYTTAEKAGDPQFLARISEAFGFSPAPADYASLRKSAIDSFLQPDMAEGSKWLGEIQTWVDVRGKTPGTPDLAVWLTRDQPAAAPAKKAKKKPVKKPDSLEAAEAGLGEFTAGEEEVSNPLDSFDEMRKNRSERKLEEAQAGMEQVASEREAAEQEYAAKKTAAAQAEAEAMKRHADKLAATEKDALEQRKNSWVNRLKSIVGATVSAATGAFTGGIGTRAGQEAANAIFESN